MNPIIRRLLSHLRRAIASTTQINFHDGHTELDTICILQVTLSSYANSCFQIMRRNMTKLWATQCPNKKSSFLEVWAPTEQWEMQFMTTLRKASLPPNDAWCPTWHWNSRNSVNCVRKLAPRWKLKWWLKCDETDEQMEEKRRELVQQNLVAIVELHGLFLTGQLFLVTTVKVQSS